ncbi:hypothetical protein PQX77_001986 [Marasmius sp. AFHP31]|nr:hypothetical protein PQX77_001986 [Marasmius sp. AFHP31]
MYLYFAGPTTPLVLSQVPKQHVQGIQYSTVQLRNVGSSILWNREGYGLSFDYTQKEPGEQDQLIQAHDEEGDVARSIAQRVTPDHTNSPSTEDSREYHTALEPLLGGATPTSPAEQNSVENPTRGTTVDTPNQHQLPEETDPLAFVEETGTRPIYTGREPWVGTRVRVIGGHFKGFFGVIKHTHIDWSLLGTIVDLTPGIDLSHVPSGLLFDIVLDVINIAQPLQRIDYRDVVEHDSWKHLNSWRPLNHYHEVWYLRPDLPDPTPRLAPYEANAPTRPVTPPPPPPAQKDVNDPWNPAAQLPPTQSDHWILHPQLVGLELEVEIRGGLYDSRGKTVPVKVAERESPSRVVAEYTEGRGRCATAHEMVHSYIRRSPKEINPSSETALMGIISGREEDIGKLVRRIRTFYLGESAPANQWMVTGVIVRDQEAERLTNERIEVHPLNVVRVTESVEQRRAAKAYMKPAREAARTEWSRHPEIRRYATAIDPTSPTIPADL